MCDFEITPETKEYADIEFPTYDENGELYIKGLKEGTAECVVSYCDQNGKPATVIGTIKFEIKKLEIKDVEVYDEYDDEKKEPISKCTVNAEDSKELNLLVITNYDNEHPITLCTAKSSDESVAEVRMDYDSIYVDGIKNGTATITITCGDVTKKVEVTVKDSDDDYDDYDDYDDDDEE